MDKELIAMCDCPEIQERIGFENWDHDAVTARDGSFPVEGDTVFLPSVSWLLREIEATEGCVLLCKELADSDDVMQYWAQFTKYGEEPDTFNSPNCDSPDKALLHILMWQKGKIWKDGEWARKEG